MSSKFKPITNAVMPDMSRWGQNELSDKTEELPCSSLAEFENHPFCVADDDDMTALMQSIAKYGVREPVLVRPSGEKFEIISGHRRVAASRKLEKLTVPAIVREMSDDEARRTMLDANLHRTNLKTSEKALSLRQRYELLKKERGGADDELDGSSALILAKQTGMSSSTVKRLSNIGKLPYDLLLLVDERRVDKAAAENLSYTDKSTAQNLADILNRREKGKIDSELAKKIRRAYDEKGGSLSAAEIEKLLDDDSVLNAPKPKNTVTVAKMKQVLTLIPDSVAESDKIEWLEKAVRAYAQKENR